MPMTTKVNVDLVFFGYGDAKGFSTALHIETSEINGPRFNGLGCNFLSRTGRIDV